MLGRVSKRRFSATTLFNLAAVAVTIGLVAVLQYGAGARAAYQPSTCTNQISSVTANPGTINQGSSTTITVNLASAAPIGGCGVDMSYSNASAFVNPPSSVTISGGSTSGNYNLTAQSNAPGGVYTITGSDDNNSQQTTVKINAIPPP